MAAPSRTFFIMLITITGVFYFLYTIYTSTLDGRAYDFRSWNKVFRNLSFSSSPYVQNKEEQYSAANSLDGGSITNTSSNNNSTKRKDSVISLSTHSSSSNISEVKVLLNNAVKENQIKGNTSTSSSVSSLNVTKLEPAEHKKKDNREELKEKKRESFIQKIPPKVENATVDYIIQGVITKTLYDSGYILPNVELCPDFGNKLRVVILVTSAPKHFEARTAIRQTWGHYQQRKDVAIGFILGRTTVAEESKLREEYDLYGDVILANFVDSYNNLTLKTVSILEWVDNYCSQAKFVLKTDDDMFINIPKLLNFIEKHLKDKRKIFGKLAKKWKPIRLKTSKYYVSGKQYNYPLFPDFTTGPAYLMTSDVIHDLYMTALEKTYLKLEDVYTTGIVAQEERIQRVHVNEFFNRRIALSPCNVQKGISIHMIKSFEQYDLWKKLLDGRTKC